MCNQGFITGEEKNLMLHFRSHPLLLRNFEEGLKGNKKLFGNLAFSNLRQEASDLTFTSCTPRSTDSL